MLKHNEKKKGRFVLFLPAPARREGSYFHHSFPIVLRQTQKASNATGFVENVKRCAKPLPVHFPAAKTQRKKKEKYQTKLPVERTVRTTHSRHNSDHVLLLALS